MHGIPEETRNRILTAATKLFYAKGISAACTGNTDANRGITKPVNAGRSLAGNLVFAPVVTVDTISTSASGGESRCL